MPCPSVAQSRLGPNAVITRSLSLEHHDGAWPGAPNAFPSFAPITRSRRSALLCHAAIASEDQQVPAPSQNRGTTHNDPVDSGLKPSLQMNAQVTLNMASS